MNVNRYACTPKGVYKLSLTRMYGELHETHNGHSPFHLLSRSYLSEFSLASRILPHKLSQPPVCVLLAQESVC